MRFVEAGVTTAYAWNKRHTDDKHLPHDTARWWSELHHVTVQNNDLPVFDKRILAPPNRTPDESTHQLWVHIIPLYIQTVIYWVLLHLNLVQILYGLTNLLHEKYGIRYYNYIRRYIFFPFLSSSVTNKLSASQNGSRNKLHF